MEDKKRNPILKYIGKPKISSQSSEYRHLLGRCSTDAPLPEGTCSHPPALGSPSPTAGTSQPLPHALLLQPPIGNPLSGPSVLPRGFEGSRKGAELELSPKFILNNPILQAATAQELLGWAGMVESLRTCAYSRVCSPSSPSAFSSHAVSSHAPSLPPSPLKRRIDLTSHFCFSFQHFMSLCPLSKVKGLFFYLPFTSCAWFLVYPPPRGTQRWGGRRAAPRALGTSPRCCPLALGTPPW